MKKLIFILLMLSLLISCKKNIQHKQDPTGLVPINLNATETKAESADLNKVRMVDEQPLYTPYQLIRLDDLALICFNKEHKEYAGRGFSEEMRDYENNKLLMSALEVYDPHHGGLQDRPNNFLAADYALIYHYKNSDGTLRDTVAYITRETLKVARERIRKAYKAGDMEGMYTIFQEAFQATPCTGKQFREMLKRDEY